MKISEKLSLEISVDMITVCENIDLAKLDNDKERQKRQEQRLGELVFKAMENCPF